MVKIKWDELIRVAGIDRDVFISIQEYPNEITYKLIAAVDQVLKINANDFLEELGVYWINFTSQGDYKDIFEVTGDNFVTFLQELDMLHTRVGSIIPNLRPPQFYCTDITKSTLTLHYVSKRAGLSSFVIGLIKGLGEYFNTKVEIKQIKFKKKNDDHDQFSVSYEKGN